MSKFFYERNDMLLESPVNVTFEEILWMSDDEFRKWTTKLRSEVVRIWDEYGCPPVVGKSEDEIINIMNQLGTFKVEKFVRECELTGDICIKNNQYAATSIVNQFFPTMMKTPITYNETAEAQSIYDWFSKPELVERHNKYCFRHFKRDSFYNYSNPARKSNKKQSLISAKTGVEWIERFEELHRSYKKHDYWLCPVDSESDYSGHNDKLRDVAWLTVTSTDLARLAIPKKCLTNINSGSHGDSDLYTIRHYKTGQKIFPAGFKAFRISYCQSVANFPTLTAKYLYQKYTEEFKNEDKIYIWDPSSGWGGRIMGAMAVKDDRNIFYVGCDPNKDHTTGEGRTKYDELVDYYHENSYRGNSLFPHMNEHKIIQCGSEVMKDQKFFKKLKGKLHLVFTSPPYFAKEVYSEDPEQSCNKFPTYDGWRDGFLRPTLETAVKWLRPGGYLLWNIADAKFGSDMLPLEKDSRDILEELGMEFLRVEKMTLAAAPGGNRIDPETGKPLYKNACKIDGKFLKYEPIFCFQKPMR